MHLKHISKFNFLKHHSIPILLHRSISLTCALALLLGMTNLLLNDKAYANSDCIVNPVEGYTCIDNGFGQIGHYEPNLTTPTSNTISLAPSISLTIDDNVVGDNGGGNASVSISDKVIAEYDKPNYSTHTVSLSASNIASYSLVLSNVGISTPTGAKMVGVDNVIGLALTSDTWGYGWDDTSVENDNISYISDVNKSLGDISVDSNNSVDIVKKLVFVTKFGEDSVAGNYKVTATLSAVAMPAEVTKSFVKWDDLVYMQDMSTDTCTYAPMGVEKTLTDIRDNSTYTIAKLSDGKCWMTQNLRITGDSMKEGLNKAITSYDSDVSTNYTVPNSGAWIGDGNVDATQGVLYVDSTTYGAYYSWCAATANTCTEAKAAGDIADSSICPKGWRLPTGRADGEIQAIFLKYPNSSSSTAFEVSNGINGYWFGAANTAAGGTFFPAAGFASAGAGPVTSAGSYGRYWSSTASSATQASLLAFTNTYIGPTDSDYRRTASSVRCIAR